MSEDPIPGFNGKPGSLKDISENLKLAPEYRSHGSVYQHIHDLGEWAFAHEATLVESLRMIINGLPLSEISKYERALDALPKGK